ncbi:hypothetical protein TRIUR3_24123 [Triticum urartu]|uniref:F-box domain-containing protein n=1 Tax=Triticum urartu TaxID=4572 RepID=M7YTJ0_TRIUA|nr:hypothetical protein TRIUR3_24123 [Triticum urartu]
MAAQQNKQEQPVQPSVCLRLQYPAPLPIFVCAAVSRTWRSTVDAGGLCQAGAGGLLSFIYPTLQLLRHGVRLFGDQDLQSKVGLLIDYVGDQDLILDSCVGLNCAIYVSSEVCSWDSGAVDLVKGLICFLSSCEAQCALLPPFYLCEIDGNGHVLAGVEIDVPGDGLIGLFAYEITRIFAMALVLDMVCSWDSGAVDLIKGLICFLSYCEGFLFYGWCQQSAHLLVHRPVFALL